MTVGCEEVIAVFDDVEKLSVRRGDGVGFAVVTSDGLISAVRGE